MSKAVVQALMITKLVLGTGRSYPSAIVLFSNEQCATSI